MTALEQFTAAIANLKTRDLSNEELQKAHATLSLKLSEVQNAINNRKHYATHSFPKKKD